MHSSIFHWCLNILVNDANCKVLWGAVKVLVKGYIRLINKCSLFTKDVEPSEKLMKIQHLLTKKLFNFIKCKLKFTVMSKCYNIMDYFNTPQLVTNYLSTHFN